MLQADTAALTVARLQDKGQRHRQLGSIDSLALKHPVQCHSLGRLAPPRRTARVLASLTNGGKKTTAATRKLNHLYYQSAVAVTHTEWLVLAEPQHAQSALYGTHASICCCVVSLAQPRERGRRLTRMNVNCSEVSVLCAGSILSDLHSGDLLIWPVSSQILEPCGRHE